MPYKSGSQRRYFHYLEEQGKMPKKTVDEFDEASKGMELPEHLAYGGEVGLTDPMGDEAYQEKQSDEDDEQKMAHGGLVSHAFAKALKRVRGY